MSSLPRKYEKMLQKARSTRKEDVAIRIYEKLLQVVPPNKQIYESALGFYLNNDRIEDAKKGISSWITHNPKDGSLWFVYASHHRFWGKPVEVEEACREGLEIQPGNLKMVTLLAQALEKQGKIRAAEELLLQFSRSHPEGDEGIWRALQAFYMRTGNAEGEGRALVEIAKRGRDEYRVGLTPYLGETVGIRFSGKESDAMSFFRSHDLPALREEYLQLCEDFWRERVSNGRDGEGRENDLVELGLVLHEQSRPDEARTLWEEAKAIKMRDYGQWVFSFSTLGDFYAEIGDFRSAILEFQKAVSHRDSQGNVPKDDIFGFIPGQSTREKLKRAKELLPQQDARERAERQQEQERALQQHHQEIARVESRRTEKLQKLMRVATKLEVAPMAKMLDLSEDQLWDRLADLAEQFGFSINGSTKNGSYCNPNRFC